MSGPGQFRAVDGGARGPLGCIVLSVSCLVFVGADLMAEESGIKVRLTSFDREDYRGELRLELGGSEWARFKYQGTDKALEAPELVLPAAAREVSFSGRVAWTHYGAGAQVSQGTGRRPIVDITQLMAPIRNRQLTWADRFAQLEKAQESFEARYEELGAAVRPRIEAGERATVSQISAAEARLGFALPPEHAQMLMDVGAWSVNSSSLTQAKDLQPAFQQLIELWETPTRDMNTLPQKTKAWLQQSVILLTEAGDGYSAVLCQPSKEEGKTAAHRYYWLMQSEINDPELLQDRDGTPFEHPQVMSWLLANQLIRQYDNVGTHATFVDFRAPVPLDYDVELLFPAPKVLEARILLEWNHFR